MSFDFFDKAIVGSLTFEMVLRVILIFLICLVAIRVLRVVASKMLKRSKLDAALKSFVLSVIRAALWILAIIIIADSLGISTASLVAVLSIIGLALSLSVQNVMSNLFSGVTLLFTRPFKTGDFVEIGGRSGTVRSIGLFYTMIETGDKVAVSIPNSDVTSSSIRNYSASDRRRVDMEFCASYDSAPQRVKNAIAQAALKDGRIFGEPKPFVAVKSYGESAVTYVLRVWCASGDYWDVYFALNESVRESLNNNGVKMTYNHLNVHIVDDRN